MDPVIQQAMFSRRRLQFATLAKLCLRLWSALTHEPYYGYHTQWRNRRDPIPYLNRLSPMITLHPFGIHFLPLCICTYGELWSYDTSPVYVFIVLICCIGFNRIVLYSLFWRPICIRTGLHYRPGSGDVRKSSKVAERGRTEDLGPPKLIPCTCGTCLTSTFWLPPQHRGEPCLPRWRYIRFLLPRLVLFDGFTVWRADS